MKKITNYILICTCALGFSSCVNTFLDLEPLDAKTDVIYFKTPEHFREYANGLYGQLLGWQSSYGSIFDHMDAASDLSTCFRYSYGPGGRGTSLPPPVYPSNGSRIQRPASFPSEASPAWPRP